jgi:4-amino-4-deoxy-L-arabinose transferase-like glycosyltransferase
VERPRSVDVLAGGALLALVAGALFFFGSGRYPLWDPDEARHAEVAREMAEARGFRRFFLPTLRFQPYREKPAPYYWLVGTAYAVGGVGEAPARGVSAAAALLVVLALYAWAAPRAGVPGALAAGLLTATSAGCFGLAHFVNLDMALTASVVVGVLTGLAWLDRPPPRRRLRAPYVAAAVATLLKGPLGAVLALGPIAIAAVLRRPRPTWRELGLVPGLAIAGALVALFWVTVWFLDPSYVSAFASTNLRRLGASSPHAAPIYYYLLWVPVLFLPWTLFAWPALRRAARDPVRRPLLLWAVFVPVVLTLATGKLATYALSTLAPLGLLVGPELARAALTGPEVGDRLLLRVGGWIATAVLGGAVAAALLAGIWLPLPVRGRVVLALLALVWAAGLAIVLRRDRPGLVPAVVLGAALSLYPTAVYWLAPAFAALHSDRDAARVVAAAGSAPVIAYAAQAHSLTFYLGTPPVHTDDPEVVRELWQHDTLLFLVTGRRHFTEIESLLGPRAHVWHTSARRRLYANRPP